jgi:hypothetical protein
MDAAEDSRVLPSPSSNSPESDHEKSQPFEVVDDHQTSKPNGKGLRRFELFGFCREIRDYIYFLMLRPDCRMNECIAGPHANYYKSCSKLHDCISTGRGRTKLLVLNRRVYKEAIGLLHVFENLITIRGKGHKVFRDPRAFGMPGFFACDKWISHCYLGPKFSELQILRLRHQALEIHYPVPSNDDIDQYFVRIIDLAKEVRQVADVLRKCKALQTFRVILQIDEVHLESSNWSTDIWVPVTVNYHADLQELLQLFLDAAESAGFTTAAEEQKHFILRETWNNRKDVCKIGSYEDPVVNWYNCAAQSRSVHSEFADSYDDKIVARRYVHESKIRQDGWSNFRALHSAAMMQDNEADNGVDDGNSYTAKDADKGGIEDAGGDGHDTENDADGDDVDAADANSDDHLTIQPPHQRERPVLVPRSDINYLLHVDPLEDWELRPECRKCYQLFETREELDAHLESKPTHKIPFVRKVYNVLHPRAQHGGDRKCFTCGKTYTLLQNVDDHNREEGHGRVGMIPRWRQDNGWWDRWEGRLKGHRHRG